MSKHMEQLLLHLDAPNPTMLARFFWGPNNNYTTSWSRYNTIHGGGGHKQHKMLLETKDSVIKHPFEGKHYKFTRSELDKHDITYFLYGKHHSDDQCMVIHNVDGETTIYNVSMTPNCSFTTSTGNSGTSLMIITLNFLLTNKEKENIKHIKLTDNSTIKCRDNDGVTTPGSIEMHLSDSYFLLHGTTWYGKFMFVPFVENDIEMTKQLIRNFQQNQHIIGTAKLTLSIKDEIIGACQNFNCDRNKLVELFDKHNDGPLYLFLRDLLKDMCIFYSRVYEMIFTKLGMFSFRSKQFIYAPKTWETHIKPKILL